MHVFIIEHLLLQIFWPSRFAWEMKVTIWIGFVNDRFNNVWGIFSCYKFSIEIKLIVCVLSMIIFLEEIIYIYIYIYIYILKKKKTLVLL
jgi:hypothetical protein